MNTESDTKPGVIKPPHPDEEPFISPVDESPSDEPSIKSLTLTEISDQILHVKKILQMGYERRREIVLLDQKSRDVELEMVALNELKTKFEAKLKGLQNELDRRKTLADRLKISGAFENETTEVTPRLTEADMRAAQALADNPDLLLMVVERMSPLKREALLREGLFIHVRERKGPEVPDNREFDGEGIA